MLVRLSGVVALASLFAACSSTTTPADPPDASEAGAACPAPKSAEACTTPPSYQHDVSPIIDTYCNNCHNAAVDGGPWPLDSYDNVHDWKELMVIDLMSCAIPGIAQGHPMPPQDAPYPLPSDKRDVIVGWLLCGAPNN